MNNFLDVFNDDNGDEELEIPTPKENADIRPSPSPMQVTRQDTVSEDDIVVKTAQFHPSGYDMSGTVQPEPFIERVEDAPRPKDIFAQETRDASDAKCFAFMGASGGSGVTTLCIQMAYDIAKRTKQSAGFGVISEPTVCLIDLDFETGSCASYLDVPPALTISDICGSPERIDASIVQALMSQHESGIAVISTPNALGVNTLANPETVLALLDAASQVYDYIILDLPRIWQPWVGAAISGADHFALVSELTIPSLHTARTRLTNIENLLGEDLHSEVVLNKVERRSFRNSVRLADAEKALQRSVSATICVDYETTREAINCGEAVQVIRPEARYVKDVKALSLKWAPPKNKASKTGAERRKKRAAA